MYVNVLYKYTFIAQAFLELPMSTKIKLKIFLHM